MTLQLFEYAVVLAVFCVMARGFALCQSVLRAACELLIREEEAFETARKNVRFHELRELGAPDIDEVLERASASASASDSRVASRILGLCRGSDAGDEALVSLEEARFWTGAFVFIGLLGTLICLSVAVFALMALVKGAGAGAGASVANSFQSVVQSMTNVFSGMGIAFCSTGLGVVFTLMVGSKVSALERSADVLESKIERFLSLEVAPLVILSREKRRAHAQNEEFARETARLEGAALLLQDAATNLAGAISAAKSSIANLGEGATKAAEKMTLAADEIGSSASVFAAGADKLTGITGELDARLERLGALLENHNFEQNQWRDGTGSVLKSISEMIAKVDATVERFDVGRAQLSELSNHTRGMLEETRALATSVDTSTRAAMSRLGEDSAQKLGEIRRAIEGGTEQERELLTSLRALCATLGDYAAHVEDEIRRLPALVGSEPFLQLEQRESKGWETLGGKLDALGTRLEPHFDGLSSRLDRLNQTAQQAAQSSPFVAPSNGKATSDFTPHIHSMEAQITTLSGAMNETNAQLRTVTSSLGRVEARQNRPFWQFWN